MAADNKIKTPRIVQSTSGGRWFLVFFLGALLGAVGWFGFDYGREWAGLSAGETGQSVRRLRQTVKQLEKEREGLRTKLTALERSGQIDREATRMAQIELKNVQDANQELEKEVAFLRNLVEEGATGALRIKDFKLSETDQAGRFSYKFTVTQIKEDFGWTKGEVLLRIEGMLEGQAKGLGMEDFGGAESKPHPIKFRHFQRINGTISLPEGYSPDSLVIDVKPSVKKLAPVSEAYDWAVSG